jgi:TRAP-type uncharacterized transport system substrate-binding protein
VEGIQATPVVTEGSLEMLERVDRGELDFAFVEGGFDVDRFRNIRQVAGLTVVPLVMLVKEEHDDAVRARFSALKGKTVNLGSGERTGTYWLSREILAFAGVPPGSYHATSQKPEELLGEKDRAKLPDAVFVVASPRSRVAHQLSVSRGYKIVPLEFGESLRAHALSRQSELPPEGIAIRKEHLPDAEIPAFAYSVSPPVPPRSVPSIGSRMLLVTHSRTRPVTVARVLEVVLSSRWANAAQPPVDKGVLAVPPEFPLHPGAIEFRDRDRPIVTSESIGFASNALQVLLPFCGGLLCLRGWIRKRRLAGREEGLEHFLGLVSEVGRRAATSHDPDALRRLHHDLTRIKELALQHIVTRRPAEESYPAIFLAHVIDVRASLVEQAARVESRAGATDPGSLRETESLEP